MNRIYKVIWSKVKHQYVVVSELAHSNGKQSRTAKKSLRNRIVSLVACGAIAAFGVLGATEQQAFAELIAMNTGMTQESTNNDVTIVIEGNMKSEEDGSYVFSEDLMDKPLGVMEIAGEHINFSVAGGTNGENKKIEITALGKYKGLLRDDNGYLVFKNSQEETLYVDDTDYDNPIYYDKDVYNFSLVHPSLPISILLPSLS